MSTDSKRFEEGLPLLEALWAYSDPVKVRAYLSVADEPPTIKKGYIKLNHDISRPGLLDALRQSANSPDPSQIKIHEIPNPKYLLAQERLAELKTRFKERVRSQDIILSGYTHPRTITSKRHDIPVNILPSDFGVDWDGSAIELDDLRIVSVRARPAITDDDLPKKTGRKSRLPEILEFCDQLEADGSIDREGKVAPAIVAIRSAAMRRYGGELPPGFSESAIRKAISPRFRERRLRSESEH